MRVFLFDIDGTLITSGGAGKAAMESALLGEFGLPNIQDGVPYSGRTDRAIGLDLLRLHGLPGDTVHWQRLRNAYLEHLPTTLPRHPGRVLPGIAGLLDHLSRLPQSLLGLLTGNIREGAKLKLSHYRLYHYFALGGFGDDHLDRDDVAREAFQGVHQHLNGTISSDQIWVIGDTPLDIRCARAIGARVVAVGTGWHSLQELADAQPDLLLEDFSDPEPLWKAIGTKSP